MPTKTLPPDYRPASKEDHLVVFTDGTTMPTVDYIEYLEGMIAKLKAALEGKTNG